VIVASNRILEIRCGLDPCLMLDQERFETFADSSLVIYDQDARNGTSDRFEVHLQAPGGVSTRGTDLMSP
jgi:hypothetical protein